MGQSPRLPERGSIGSESFQDQGGRGEVRKVPRSLPCQGVWALSAGP